MLDRAEDAIDALGRGKGWELSAGRAWSESLQHVAQGRRPEALAATRQVLAWSYRDPETYCHLAGQLAFLDAREEALAMLQRAVDDGFFCAPALSREPWLDGL